MPLEDLQKERIKKLRNLQKLGIDPYPAKTDRKHTIEVARKMMNKKVVVAGRLRSLRPHGKIAFADLEDGTAKIQLLFRQDPLKGEKFDLLPNFDIGDFLEASGEVIRTQAGEITVDVDDFNILAKSIRPLPSDWYGLKDVEERLRKRYLDLILDPEVKELFVKKSKFWSAIRKYMLDDGFLEVETPVLQPIPGGADARPFITHMNALDIELYLRISLELPLKRLIVAGYEKVFEIGRIFRNEGIDDEHLQDYTQLEFYWAYADYNQLMDFVRKMYQKVIEETFGTLKLKWKGEVIDWSGKWPVVDYTKLLDEHWGVKTEEMNVTDLYELAKKLKVAVEPNLGKGRLLDYIYKKTIRPKLIQPMFVINHPVEVEPLAKRVLEDPDKVQRMQILAMGTELGKGFSELNDPIDQRERFEEQMKLRELGDDEAQMLDEDYVEAMEYGMPPNAGFGISERLFAMLIDRPIRETVFFPMMRPEKKEESKSQGVKESEEKFDKPFDSAQGGNKLPDEKSKRFIAVLNKKVEPGRLMNALGHMTAGLSGKFENSDEMHFLKYEDGDGGVHPFISHFPFIVLQADNSNQIRTVRNEAIKRGIAFNDFTSTMTVGTSEEQRNNTKATPEAELEYWGICLFGDTEELAEFTKKFSLFR